MSPPIILIWAWKADGKDRVDAMVFDDEGHALATARAFLNIAGDAPRVRLFKTPNLDELDI